VWVARYERVRKWYLKQKKKVTDMIDRFQWYMWPDQMSMQMYMKRRLKYKQMNDEQRKEHILKLWKFLRVRVLLSLKLRGMQKKNV
jgi:hypothetical protein